MVMRLQSRSGKKSRGASFPRCRKSQGAFEYILLLGGVLLIVVVAIIILRGSVLNQANKQVAGNVNAWQGVSCIPTFMSSSGNVRGLWRFDGDYSDSSGKGNNGVPSGSPTFIQGKKGQAVNLAPWSKYIQVNDNPALALPSTGYTIEAWVNITSYSNPTNYNIVLSRRDGCGNANYELYTYNPTLDMRVYTTLETPVGPAPAANQWAHIAVVYSGGTTTFYLNGQLSGSNPHSFSPTGSSGLRIGTDGTCGNYFNGYIDDVVLYDRALSQQEIQQDMNCVG